MFPTPRQLGVTMGHAVDRCRPAGIAALAVAVVVLMVSPGKALADLTVSANIVSLGCGNLAQINISSAGFAPGTTAGVTVDNGEGYYTAASAPVVEESGEFNVAFGGVLPPGTYTVTVFVDEDRDQEPDPGSPIATTTVNYCVGPTTKEDCQGGGFGNYPGFSNQGDCVAFLATNGKNEPGQNIPGSP
jgi:uncharacterized protein (DUF2141 family)